MANILFLASKFETKLKNFGKEIFCEKRKFTGHRRNFRIAVVEALDWRALSRCNRTQWDGRDSCFDALL